MNTKRKMSLINVGSCGLGENVAVSLAKRN